MLSAINATQVEVKFNTKVDPSTVFAAGTSGTLKSGLVTFNDLDPNTAGTNDVTGNSSTGVLSTDGKTLTITADTGKVFEGRYDVKISGVKDVDGNNVEVYDKKVLDLGKDTTLPTITDVEKLNASTIKVYFSEPLSDEGTWTFKDANGDSVIVTGASSHVAGESSVTLTINNAVDAGTEITATVIGAKDQANNLISPNPTTFKFTKGAKDGVKPEVSSVTALGLNKFEIKFSEELSTLDIIDIQIAGTPIVDFAIDSTNGGVLKQDKDDKTKYTVELNGTSILTAGLHKIELAAAATTDLSGEDLKVFSQIVEFKADLVAPTFVSSEIVFDANKDEKLVLTFDKEVTQPAAFTTIVAKELNKNSVTTTDALDAGQLTVNPNNKKQLEVVLNTVNFDGAALNKDATYTVNFPDAYVAGVNGVDVEAFNVSFTRGEDEVVLTSDKPEIASGDIVVVDTNTITVEFDKEVVGSTAINVANYSIPGVVIETATLAAVSGGTQTVTLKLKKDSNTLTGDRAITIKNVQAKNGAVMDTHTESLSLVENVVPTVVNAKFTGTNGAGNVDKITLTFSEAVKATNANTDLFEIFVGTSTTALPVTNTDQSGNATNKIELTITTPLTPTQVAESVTVKLKGTNRVLDLNTNKLDFSSIKAAF